MTLRFSRCLDREGTALSVISISELIQLDHPDVSCRFSVLVHNLIATRRPRRVTHEGVQLLVLR